MGSVIAMREAKAEKGRKSKGKGKGKRLHISIPVQLHKQIEELLNDENSPFYSVSDFIHYLIVRYFDQKRQPIFIVDALTDTAGKTNPMMNNLEAKTTHDRRPADLSFFDDEIIEPFL